MTGSLPVDWALEYARHGLVVMPLRRAGNVPHAMLDRGWTLETVGSSDPDVVAGWWSADGGDPAANVGIVCGSRSRLLVVDVDVKRRDGRESLREWIAEDPDARGLRGYAWAQTPSGGLHLWFRLPTVVGEDGAEAVAEVRRKIGWLPGVDACGDGGYVAAPPSCRWVSIRSPKPWEPGVRELRQYEWRGGDWRRTAEASAELLADVERREPVHVDGSGNVLKSGSELPPTAEFVAMGFGWFTGSRNTDLYRLAWRLLGRPSGVDPLEIIRECYEATPDTSDFGWDEVLKTVESVRTRRRRFTPSLDWVPQEWRRERVR